MQSLSRKTEHYELTDGRDALMINCTHNSIMKNLRNKDKILEEYKVNPDTIYTKITDDKTFIEYKKTWADFLDECILVQQSLVKHNSRVDTEDEFKTGDPIFPSLRDYLIAVGEEHGKYYSDVLEFRHGCVPAIDELTVDQSINLISQFLTQKKSIDQILDSFNYNMLLSFTATLAKEHATLHQKKSPSTSPSKKPKK